MIYRLYVLRINKKKKLFNLSQFIELPIIFEHFSSINRSPYACDVYNL